MIRTKAYILKELGRLRKCEKKLQQELDMMNKLGGQVKEHLFFETTKKVIKKELITIGGEIKFALWVANTSEKSLPKLKKKKKSNKKEQNDKEQ